MHYLILLLIMLGCTASTRIKADIPVNSGKDTHEYVLENGLKLIVHEDHRAPLVVSHIWYKVGGSYEHNGYTGISHALEHMMFKGTPKHPPGEFSRMIATHGGQHNAFTAHDYTGYFQQVEASQLPLCFELEADRMRNLTLSAEEFAKEIKVVMEERRQRVDDNPEARAKEHFYAGAYINNPYQHPTIGWMGDIMNLSIEDIKKWYRKWYGPNNAVLVVVGDVQPEKVFELAKYYFGKIDPISVPRLKPQVEEMPLGQRRIQVNISAEVPYLFLGFNVPCVFTAEEYWEPYALMVLWMALDGGNSARFSQNLIRGKSVAASIGSWYNPFTLYSSVLTLFGTPSSEQSLDTLEQAFLKEIAELQNNLLSDAELARIKTKTIAENLFNKDSLLNKARDLGSFEAIGLSWQLSEAYLDVIQSITKEQVQQVAKKYLTADRLIVTQLIPTLSGS